MVFTIHRSVAFIPAEVPVLSLRMLGYSILLDEQR